MPHHDTVIRGRLKALSIADVLVFFKGLARAGRLILRRDQDEVVLDLRGPWVVRAASTRGRDRLEDVLLASGRLTPEQYESVRRQAGAEAGAGIGRALITAGILSPRDLVAARRDQARRIVLALFDWTDGEYRFEEGRTPSGWTTPVDLPILGLIAEGIRGVSRPDLFLERVPSPDWAFEAEPEPETAGPRPALEPQEERILALLDGRRTVGEIEPLTELPPLETRRVLFLLLVLGRIRPVSRAAAEDGEGIDALLRRFNGIYGRVYQYMTIELGPISESLLSASLRELEGAAAAIFRRARLGGDGTLDEGILQENLRRMTRAGRKDALVEGLSELLYRELLVLRQTLGPEHETRVLSQLRRDGLLGASPAAGTP